MKKGVGLIQLKTVKGDIIEHRGRSINPISKSLIIRFPFGGYVWNRPVAIEVHESGGSRHIPIVDVTLLAQITLLVSGLVTAGIIHLVDRRLNSNSK